MSGVSITAVAKAKNEARQIADCIESVKNLATEVIVVNDMSEDDTAGIARRLGARVVDAESKDGMINELDKIGFEAASGDWILRIDADERMTPTLARRLREVAESGRYAGVRFARKNIMFGGWVKHGGWFRSDQLRFFRADAWDRGWQFEDIHSQVPVRGDILTLPAKPALATIHLDYDSVCQFVKRTLFGYARTEAEVMICSGVRFSPFRLVFKPLKRFIGRYLVRQGFRDGWRGLILAALLAAYDVCIEANLWDLERRDRCSRGR